MQPLAFVETSGSAAHHALRLESHPPVHTKVVPPVERVVIVDGPEVSDDDESAVVFAVRLLFCLQPQLARLPTAHTCLGQAAKVGRQLRSYAQASSEKHLFTRPLAPAATTQKEVHSEQSNVDSDDTRCWSLGARS